MPKVRALQKLYYDRRDRLPGDVYQMDDREDFKILCALGKIELVGEQERAEVPARAEEPPVPRVPRVEEDRRRYYRRRDMRPKG